MKPVHIDRTRLLGFRLEAKAGGKLGEKGGGKLGGKGGGKQGTKGQIRPPIGKV